MKRGRENDGENWAGSSGRDDAGCSKSKRDDHVSEDILNMLDLESNPASSDGDDMSDPVLEPKHQIFLSHSGQQKGFTELLCRELERWGYSPFFDIREDSLPKGKKFPELIFGGARQCRVAVLILSEEYFTKTKWPMLELAAFVEAQEKRVKEKRPPVDILPVYLGLTREECRKDENVSRWQKRWEEMENLEMAEKMKEMEELGRAEARAQCKAARERGELRSQKWKDAMKVLGPSNGIEYERSSREAGLIERVVSAVRHLLPPPSMASDPGCQAKGRICTSLIKMISRTQASSNGARVVGVYGMGGMGKTTFCKELCCELYKKFEGKVCHVELGRLSGSELRKKVVQKLTDVSHCSLSSTDDSKVTDYLRTRMAGEKVFLAVDDVWPESKGEAMVYVQQALYGKGSIVMVTARSIDVLLSLGIWSDNCFAMLELEEGDARQLFLHHAARDFQSQGSEDEDCIRQCVYECHFPRVGKSGGHFLPLALKVLGEEMHGVGGNPSKWMESLSKDKDKFDLDRKKEHPVFFILGRGYDSLRAEDQLLFMDVVLCNPYSVETLVWSDSLWTLFEWLSIVHYGTSSKESLIRDRLQGLKARALLEDIGDGRGGVNVHDLYGEFAKFEANRGDLDGRCVVWHVHPATLPVDLVKTPSGNCWSRVKRIGIKGPINYWYPRVDSPSLSGMDEVKWQHFANVEVLELHIGARDQRLDLQGLRCLRSLVVAANGSPISGLGKMGNLGWLDLDGIYCGHGLEEIGCLTTLQMLRVSGYCEHWKSSDPPLSINGLRLEKCINLRELVVECRCLQALPDLGGMKFLKKVHFRCPRATEGLGGLDSQLCALHEFRMTSSGSFEDRLPRLHEVVSLQVLHVYGLPWEVFPDIWMLRRLRELVIWDLPKLVLVPGLGELVALEMLSLAHLPKLRELPNMHLLTKLQCIAFWGVSEVRKQSQLLNMVPSQLLYFHSGYDGFCILRCKDLSDDIDLHEWYKSLSATMLSDIDPKYPRWGVPKML